MALQKTRDFRYRPSRKRLEQQGEPDAHRIRLPKAGDKTISRGNKYALKLFLMFAGVVGLALILMYVRI